MASQFDKLIWQLSDSARLSAEEIRRLHAGLAADRVETVAGEEFVRELLRLEKLTPPQAASLVQAVNPGIELGEFLLLERLGQSRSAMVFRAEHRRLQRVVALKVLAPHRFHDSGVEQRVVEDVRRLTRLIHPHLVATWGLEKAGGLQLLATEFVPGTDLLRLVRTRGALSVRQAVEYVRQAAEALEFLHRRGVVHRNIQPSHLLLDETGQIRLLGAHLFAREGVAERCDEAMGGGQEDADLSAASAASVAYLAPEQALDDDRTDPRSDLYGLGCTLYFLVSGRQPYEADTVVRQILAHRQHPAPVLSKVSQFVAPEVEAIFQRLVAKRPEDRFSTVGELLLAISRLEPIDSDSVLDMDIPVEMPVAAPPVNRSLAARDTIDIRMVARDDGTIMEMPIQTDIAPTRLVDSAGRPRPPQVEPRLWFFLAMIVAAAALLLGLLSWALTATRGRARSVRGPSVAARPAQSDGKAATVLKH